MTIIGCLVGAFMLAIGNKPKKWGYCYYFEIGKGWGGLELGPVFLTSKNPTSHIRNHELGHGMQNCYFGIGMPFIVCIPSAIRYWYRSIRQFIGAPCKTKYDDIWFEGDATKLGTEFMEWYNTK
jgi:hypothetical protein